MAEYSYSGNQEVQANDVVLFNEAPDPCRTGLVRHRDGTGSFLLSGVAANQVPTCPCGCRKNSVNYQVTYGANIAVADGGTAGPISIGLALDSVVIPSSVSTVTPSVTGAYFNVGKSMSVPIWTGCCQTLSLVNTSNQTIDVQNANMVISR